MDNLKKKSDSAFFLLTAAGIQQNIFLFPPLWWWNQILPFYLTTKEIVYCVIFRILTLLVGNFVAVCQVTVTPVAGMDSRTMACRPVILRVTTTVHTMAIKQHLLQRTGRTASHHPLHIRCLIHMHRLMLLLPRLDLHQLSRAPVSYSSVS